MPFIKSSHATPVSFIIVTLCRSYELCIKPDGLLVTGRNEVVAKVMFLLVSVILSTGGCLPQCMLGYHHPWEQTPPQEQTHPPRSRHPPPEQTPPRSKHPPPGAHTPPPKADSSIRSMNGRYASYWNAFLLGRVSTLDVSS